MMHWSVKIQMNDFGCSTCIWLHHLNKKQIKILHRRNKKHNMSNSTIISLSLSEYDNNTLFKNHATCDYWNYGMPKPEPKRLANTDVKYGASKTKTRFKKIDFTNGSTPPCVW